MVARARAMCVPLHSAACCMRWLLMSFVYWRHLLHFSVYPRLFVGNVRIRAGSMTTQYYKRGTRWCVGALVLEPF